MATERKKILDAWIMVEHLSEGDIKKNDKALLPFDDLSEGDYYGLFREQMLRQKIPSTRNGGMVVYFGIFEFDEVVKFLRKKYNLAPPPEEVRTGTKFALGLYFDKALNLLEDMTFFTESAYIRAFSRVPKQEEFRKYEEELRTRITQFFKNTADKPEQFNRAVEKVLELQVIPQPEIPRPEIPKPEIPKPEGAVFTAGRGKLPGCRFQLLKNVESETVNLHSFFIRDLETAKTVRTDNLDKYLFQTKGKRFNLDSRRDSVNFAPELLAGILAPEHYPLGRFPGTTEHALSFMQQVAINLAAGADPGRLRSVNGPPGTGKTTLLKDIFAELVVRQAYDMAKLSSKAIRGTAEMQYFEKASIGTVPDSIAVNGIVVASSNNGAVQNIVNELPLVSAVDEALAGELKEADYFRRIANASVTEEWKDGKKELSVREEEEDWYWGLFSMEGGRADNMSAILSRLRAILDWFGEEDYEEDDDAYDDFLKQYGIVREMRNKAQKAAEALKKCEKDRKARDELALRVRQETAEWERKIADARAACSGAETEELQEKGRLESELEELRQSLAECEQRKADMQAYLNMLREDKPGIFAGKAAKEQYSQNLVTAQTTLGELLQEAGRYQRRMQEVRRELSRQAGQTGGKERSLKALKSGYRAWRDQTQAELDKLEKRVAAGESAFRAFGALALDLGLPYEELQLSNPWFGEDYRIAQSRLFIAALRVRKQFLYENRRNLRAAVIIWSRKKEYLERRGLIKAAWDWINLAIPVISSTFASFGRMCEGLSSHSLGHLFIDEAGQALPQAAVGAMIRARHVMALGDPAQIKPVLTLDANVLDMLRTHFDVPERYLSESASVQTLIDAVSPYGYYRDPEMTDASWIGIPLWVHRRCQDPMFSISNKISYDNLMVQGKEGYGRTGWYDISGKANNKYVEEQGEFLCRKIGEMMEADPSIGDRAEKDKIYVISPFVNVAWNLARLLRRIHFTRYDEQGKATNVGTIHTFQGKEAPIVFLVLGADRQSSGAARWAVSEANMMNVAATRAREEFYIIGDRKLYLDTGCDVAADTWKIISRYKKEHPELVSDEVSFAEPEKKELLPENMAVETPDSSKVKEEDEKPETLKTQEVSKKSKEPEKLEKPEKPRTLEKPRKSKEPEMPEKVLRHEIIIYVGNRLNTSFHRADCKYAPRNPQKRIEFHSREEALAAGYKPCPTCRP